MKMPADNQGELFSNNSRVSPLKPVPGEHFLKGPISWLWLSQAARLSGKSLQVALQICYWRGIRRSDRFPLSVSSLEHLGVSRSSAYRALHALEEAGLIAVERHRGRRPIVTIRPAPRHRVNDVESQGPEETATSHR